MVVPAVADVGAFGEKEHPLYALRIGGGVFRCVLHAYGTRALVELTHRRHMVPRGVSADDDPTHQKVSFAAAGSDGADR